MGTQKRSYADYEGRPEFLLPDGFRIRELEDEVEILDLNGRLSRSVAKGNFYDQLIPTMRGLVADLAQGSTFAEDFEKEWGSYQDGDADMSGYGVLVHYPRHGHVVRYAPAFWHRLALVVRNATLFLDPEMKLSWKDARKIFDGAVVAFAGCSLGNGIVHASVSNLRPKHVKIADPDIFDLTNANRVRVRYDDLGRNKAIVTAEQLHAIDPFLKISVFSEGVHQGNVDDFIGGNPALSEPPAIIIVDAVDNPYVKIMLREKAREAGVAVVMGSDIGSGAQRDVQRYDLDRRLSLAPGRISDEKILAVQERYRKNPSLENFFRFAFGLIGYNYRRMPEFRVIVESLMKNGTPPEFGGAPQLGSTAVVAAGLVAEALPRILLGHKIKKQTFVDITNVERSGK